LKFLLVSTGTAFLETCQIVTKILISKSNVFAAVITICFFPFFVSQAAAQSYEQELKQLAEKLSVEIEAKEIKKIIVIDFCDLEQNISKLGRFLASELDSSLFDASKKYSMVDRNNLDYILKELKFGQSGLANPKNVKKLGHFSGV